MIITYLAKYHYEDDGKDYDVAFKRYTKNDKSNMKEIKILKNMGKQSNHPNVVQYIRAKKTENNFYMALEYCSEGDLCMYLHKNNGFQTEKQALLAFSQIVHGYKSFRQNHYGILYHRDIKPQNILVHRIEDADFLLFKITDFGTSLLKLKDGKTIQNFGDEDMVTTPIFAPPTPTTLQYWDDDQFRSKCQEIEDIWRLGITFYHM